MEGEDGDETASGNEQLPQSVSGDTKKVEVDSEDESTVAEAKTTVDKVR